MKTNKKSHEVIKDFHEHKEMIYLRYIHNCEIKKIKSKSFEEWMELQMIRLAITTHESTNRGATQ